jgi:hypothetical protein
MLLIFICFSQPDTLLNLTMMRLQQETLFADNANYANFLQMLPPNLRPFGQNSILDYDRIYEDKLSHQEPECSIKRALPEESVNCGMKRQNVDGP